MSKGEGSPQYIGFMTQPFVEGLGSIEAAAHSREHAHLKPWLRPLLSQTAVKAALAAVDWEATGLPVRDTPNGDSLQPDQVADRLMTFAYDDAAMLLQASITFLEQTGHQDTAEIARILHGSASRVLLPATLDDTHKNRVRSLLRVKVLNDSDEVKLLQFYSNKPPLVRRPLHLDGANLLQWHPALKDWMVDKSQEAKGCPAHRQLVRVDSQTMPLTHFMWHKFVDFAYAT